MIHGVIRGVGSGGVSISRLWRTLNLDCIDDMMQCSETKTDFPSTHTPREGCVWREVPSLFTQKQRWTEGFAPAPESRVVPTQTDVRGLEEWDAWALGDCDIYWIMHCELQPWLAAFPAADHYTSDTVRRTSTCMASPRLRLGGGVGSSTQPKSRSD